MSRTLFRRALSFVAASSIVLSLFFIPIASAASIGSGSCISTANSSSGVIVASSGSYCYVAFTSTGSNSWTAPTGISSADFLIIAGGGAGGAGAWGGGGGAGELVSYTGYAVSSTSATSLYVGAGGTSGTASLDPTLNRSNPGNNSWVGSSSGVVAKGGGEGASYGYGSAVSYTTGGDGGSGGGGSEQTSASPGGSSLKTSSGSRTGYGNSGGSGGNGAGTNTGGGGGGSGAAGANASGSNGGKGGNGTTAFSTWISAISSQMPSSWQTATTSGYIAAGGGGGASTGTVGAGGSGGGASGVNNTGTNGIAGVASTGSGGGGTGYGGTNRTGGSGGSGLIVIRYARLLAPTNSVIPSISGNTNFGETLTATNGTWANSPTSYTYQWSRASVSGGSYSNIAGATNQSYVLVSADVNQYLKVTVTATNAAGSTSSVSTATSVVGLASQTITLSTLGAATKTYPYSQALSMSTTGSTGVGAITYSITSGGTASGCQLSDSTSTAVITATSAGTCKVIALIAADSNYDSATSNSLTFTFSLASQASLAIASVSGSYGTSLNLTTSGGSGSGGVSYLYAAGTANCTLSGATLTAQSIGTCLITATKASDDNYSAISSPQTTITFGAGTSHTSIELVVGNLVYRQNKNIAATTSVAGKLSFKVNGKNIPGCRNLVTSEANSYTRVCAYRPSFRGYVVISVYFSPNDPNFTSSSISSPRYFIGNRSGTR